MDKDFIKRNTEAHGWLGLIISSLLFVVFFTGSISFFRHDIEQWAIQGHFQFDEYSPEEYLPVSEVFEVALAGRSYNPPHGVEKSWVMLMTFSWRILCIDYIIV